MRRLPQVVFGALVVATVGAFFVTQHLKVTTPLVAGFPAPSPAVINPYGASCTQIRAGVPQHVDHSRMHISFYLLHRSDDVSLYVVDSGGNIVRTLASSRHMRRGVRYPDGYFTWDGRENDGTVAPDGRYFLRVALLGQGRTLQLTPKAITVKTVPPRPFVRRVFPALIPAPGSFGDRVRIRYGGNARQSTTVEIYRTDLPGTPRVVASFLVAPSQPALWNGLVGGSPAPAGTYLVGLRVTDRACNVGRFPPVVPPVPGTTAHAGVSLRYLAAQSPRTASFASPRDTGAS